MEFEFGFNLYVFVCFIGIAASVQTPERSRRVPSGCQSFFCKQITAYQERPPPPNFPDDKDDPENVNYSFLWGGGDPDRYLASWMIYG